MGRMMKFRRRAVVTAGILLAAVSAFSCPSEARAAAGNTALKLYEVAGAGGLSGATYRQDTIILFNPTQAAVTCSTCAIQTHSGTSNSSSWTVYKLPALNIPAGGFYMIAASSPTLSTSGSLPPIAYDYRLKTIEGTIVDGTSGDNILSSTVGTVALTNTQTALATATTNGCASGSQLLDLVGYGSDIGVNTATAATPSICYIGNGEAFYDGSSAYGRQLGVARKNKCIDTFDNAADWANLPVFYLNSTSAPFVCPTGTQLSAALTASPTNPGVLESVTLKATVTKATSPASTGVSVLARFDSPYYAASTQQMYDDGTHGDAVAGDGVFTLTTVVPSTTPPGFTYPIYVSVTDALGNSFTGGTTLYIANGTVTLSSSKTTGTVAAGGVLTFPVTVTGAHGYGGILNVVCTGTPNTNSLGVPISTQCVSTPPEVTITSNGSATFSLAIATGTTFPAGAGGRSTTLGVIGLLSGGLLSLALLRRKRWPAAALLGAITLLTMSSTGCGTNAGIGNTSAAAGVYTYVLTATDSQIAAVTNSLTFTITVQ